MINEFELNNQLNDLHPVQLSKDDLELDPLKLNIAKRIAERLKLRLWICEAKPADLARQLINMGVYKATSDSQIRKWMAGIPDQMSLFRLFIVSELLGVEPGYFTDKDNQQYMQDQNLYNQLKVTRRKLRGF